MVAGGRARERECREGSVDTRTERAHTHACADNHERAATPASATAAYCAIWREEGHASKSKEVHRASHTLRDEHNTRTRRDNRSVQ